MCEEIYLGVSGSHTLFHGKSVRLIVGEPRQDTTTMSCQNITGNVMGGVGGKFLDHFGYKLLASYSPTHVKGHRSTRTIPGVYDLVEFTRTDAYHLTLQIAYAIGAFSPYLNLNYTYARWRIKSLTHQSRVGSVVSKKEIAQFKHGGGLGVGISYTAFQNINLFAEFNYRVYQSPKISHRCHCHFASFRPQESQFSLGLLYKFTL
jgi:opacity protein-like surface antigen